MSDHEIVYRPIATNAFDEPFDPSDHERPTLSPVLRSPAPAPTVTVHLAQIAILVPGDRGRVSEVWRIESWCSSLGAVAFDPRVATCPACLRNLRAEVSQ